MQTIRGIYNNLAESTYDYTYHGITYYFSSDVYRRKFIDRLESFIDEELDKLSVRFKTTVEGDDVLAVKLYSSIEKRGFLIEYKGKLYSDNIKIDLKLKL